MKTTKKHFRIFVKECEKWLNLFGLKAWEIEIVHRNHPGLPDTLSWMQGARLKDRIIKIGLSIDWGDDVITVKGIKLCAIHECLELLFIRLSILAKERFITEYEIDEEQHAILRTLEKILITL